MSSLAPMHASSAARDANDFLAALGSTGGLQATGAPTTSRVGLAPRTEFRFETEPETSVTITLASGTAEVFGAELVPRRPYTFADAQLAVFTWHGCTLDVLGPCGHSYVAEETPMASYLQLHNELEERRALAAAHGTSGPRVLVTGPKETGKSSLCRLLANYLVRNHRSALMVDLDVTQGDIALPGCVAAASVERPLDPQGSTEDLTPLAYWLGHVSANEHAVQFKRAVGALAEGVEERLGADAAARAGGLVINTAGWVDGPGYDSLLQQIDAFRADVLVVIGDDRLHSQLSAYVAQSTTPRVVRKLSKSGGVISRSAAARTAAANARVREYFYGVPGDLCPHSTIHDFDALQVSTIGIPPRGPATALPIGAKLPQDQLAATRVAAAQWPSLTHAVLAVVFSEESAKCDDLVGASAAGFVYVSSVDMDKQQVTLLAPSPLPMPTATLLAGSIKWL